MLSDNNIPLFIPILKENEDLLNTFSEFKKSFIDFFQENFRSFNNKNNYNKVIKMFLKVNSIDFIPVVRFLTQKQTEDKKFRNYQEIFKIEMEKLQNF